MLETTNNTKKIKVIRILVLSLVFLLILSFVVVSGLIFDVYINEGTMMEPTIKDGKKIAMSKYLYKNSGIKRFNIIAFSNGGDEYLISRVIGLPGDNLNYQEVTENGVTYRELYVNNILVKEKFIKVEQKQYTCTSFSYNDLCLKDGITMGEGKYFVINDNRQYSSNDSRSKTDGILYNDILAVGNYPSFLAFF